MDRSKLVAVVTGAIALLLSIAYLIIVQFLDFRGEMLPAPTDVSAQPQSQISELAIAILDRPMLSNEPASHGSSLE